jgi:hydroxymethylglutaryl-CoA lyase
MTERRIRITEMAPRDGLQNEREVVPLDAKVAFIDRLSDAGVSEIEVTSFVSPTWVPQLADASDVLSRIKRRRGTVYSALVHQRHHLREHRAISPGCRCRSPRRASGTRLCFVRGRVPLRRSDRA